MKQAVADAFAGGEGSLVQLLPPGLQRNAAPRAQATVQMLPENCLRDFSIAGLWGSVWEPDDPVDRRPRVKVRRQCLRCVKLVQWVACCGPTVEG